MKTAEALVLGKWVIATSIAMRGYEDFLDAEGLIIANDSVGFRRAVGRFDRRRLQSVTSHGRRERRYIGTAALPIVDCPAASLIWCAKRLGQLLERVTVQPRRITITAPDNFKPPRDASSYSLTPGSGMTHKAPDPKQPVHLCAAHRRISLSRFVRMPTQRLSSTKSLSSSKAKRGGELPSARSRMKISPIMASNSSGSIVP